MDQPFCEISKSFMHYFFTPNPKKSIGYLRSSRLIKVRLTSVFTSARAKMRTSLCWWKFFNLSLDAAKYAVSRLEREKLVYAAAVWLGKERNKEK